MTSIGMLYTGLVTNKANCDETSFPKRVLTLWPDISGRRPTINQKVTITLDLPENYVEESYPFILVHRCYGYIYDLYLEK